MHVCVCTYVQEYSTLLCISARVSKLTHAILLKSVRVSTGGQVAVQPHDGHMI